MTATVVLVHGAFHGAWCWNKVVDGLQKLGIPVIAPDLPGHGKSSAELTDLYGDAALVREIINRCDGRVVLTGHSYGGAVITEAADEPLRLQHMLYVAAGVPNSGESLADCMSIVVDSPAATAMRVNDAGAVYVDPERAIDLFYHDCSPEIARWALSLLDAQHPRSGWDKVSQSLWNTVDSTYIICEDDHIVDVATQRTLAARCKHQVSIAGGHSPMINNPELLVSLLAELASPA